MESITHIATVTDLYHHFNIPMLQHTLYALVRIEDVKDKVSHIPMNFSYGFYALGLKKGLTGYMKYGRRAYDFKSGVLAFTSPNQILSFDNLISENASGWYFFFHKEILSTHILFDKLGEYRFFEYETHEALHLSEKEEVEINSIFERLFREYEMPTDNFSKQLIASSLDVLLLYCQRYYKRQFITRDEVDSSFLTRFNKELLAAFDSNRLAENGIPSVVYLADKMNVSPNYLSDLLRTITGSSTLNHIHLELLRRSKNLIMNSQKRISQIAYELGFEYPQHFSSFFKDKTGISPTQYRNNPHYLTPENEE